MLILQFKLQFLSSFHFCTLYRSPLEKVEYIDYVNDILNEISETHYDILLLGDLNLDLRAKDKFDNYVKNPQLFNMCHMFGMDQLINEYTRVNHRSSALIDHIYSTMLPVHCKSGVVKTSVSDHYMTYTILKHPEIHKTSKTTTKHT